MNKPKITIAKKPLTDIQRDIYTAAAQEISPGELSNQLKGQTEFVFEPDVIEHLKKLGITPEQLVEQMRSGMRGGDLFVDVDESES